MKHNIFLFAKFPRFLEADNMDGYNNSSVEETPKQSAELGSTPKEVLESEESKRLIPEEVNDIISGVDEGVEAPNAPLTIKESPVTEYTLTWPDGVEKHIAIDDKTLKVETSDWEIENREDVEVRVSPEIEVDRAVYDGDGKLVLQPGDTLPEGAITEFVDGEFAWEQLLSWKAALYTATIAGKRVPKDEEYDQTLDNENSLDLELLNTTPAAGRRSMNGNFYNKGGHLYLWSSTESTKKSNAWRRNLYHNQNHTTVDRYDRDKSHGFAVRCLKDQ